MAAHVDRASHAHRRRAEVGRGHRGWRGERRLELRRAAAAEAEIRADSGFIPTQLIGAPPLLRCLVLAVAPLVVCFYLVAREQAPQIALEPVLPLLQILADVLNALDVEHRRRAIAAIQPLVHLGDRRGGAVALQPRGNHERVVRLRVTRGLRVGEIEHRAGQRRIERPRQLDARHFGSGGPVPPAFNHAAAAHALCARELREDHTHCGQKYE